VAAVVTGLCAAYAQQPARDKPQPQASSGYRAVLENIDLLIDNYANFLARKYDLTEEQDRYTRNLIRERCYEFIDKYSDELGDLVDELFAVRRGADMTPEQLIEWGRRALPIYEEAKQIIIRSNDEWREILTEKQRALHDEDLRLMYRSFETTDEQLQRIVSGEMTVEEFRNPRRYRTARHTPPAPPRKTAPPAAPREAPLRAQPVQPMTPDAVGNGVPAEERDPRVKSADQRPAVPPSGAKRPAGRVPRPPVARPPGARSSERPESGRSGRTVSPRTTRPVVGRDYEGEWDRYVEEFIRKYRLDDAQKQQAHAILNDCKKQAERYLQSRKALLERIEQKTRTLKQPTDKKANKKSIKDRGKQLADLAKQREKLLEPIQRIFERQLKPRLERLPTRAQRRAAEQAKSKKPAGKAGSGP